MKMVDYLVCFGETLSELALEVKPWARQGYVPVPGFSTLGTVGHSERVYFQAMGRFEPEAL